MSNVLTTFSIRKLIVAIALGTLLFSSAARAQTDDTLPPAGITPGSPFFFLDRLFEDIGTFFIFDEAGKAQRYLARAEERLAEAGALAEQQDENSAAATALYEEQLAEAKVLATGTGNIDLESEVTSATTKHLSVLDDVIARVPEEAREQVRTAKERTMTGHIEAMRGIARRDPERAAGIFAEAAEGRLRAAQAIAERGGDDEEEAEEVEETLAEYQKYAAFGEEISQIAQGLGTGETEVRALIERATEQHLQVLQDVRAKVPPQAQDGINRAVQNANRVRQGLPADIPGRVGPGTGGGQGDARGAGGADQATPGAGSIPEGVSGGDSEDEQETETEEAGQRGGAPEDIPAGGQRP